MEINGAGGVNAAINQNNLNSFGAGAGQGVAGPSGGKTADPVEITSIGAPSTVQQTNAAATGIDTQGNQGLQGTGPTTDNGGGNNPSEAGGGLETEKGGKVNFFA